MTQNYLTKVGIMIGRFQPLHRGHTAVIDKMMSENDHVLVLIGSANQYDTIKNPIFIGERIDMVLQYMWISGHPRDKIHIRAIDDTIYNDTVWISDVQQAVGETLAKVGKNASVTLYGHTKEDTYYLKLFPQWKYVEVPQAFDIDATRIREEWFKNGQHVGLRHDHTFSFFEQNLHISTISIMRRDVRQNDDLQADWEYYKAEEKKFSDYPYKETLNFLCGDALVECAGHVLLIERKHAPGRGKLAIPGGFKNRDETLLNCAIRELFEETNIRVPEKTIRKCIVRTHVFDHPNRNIGIPRITQAVHIIIEPNPDGSLPRANGCDDAAKTLWIPIGDVVSGKVRLFDDHSDIVKFFCFYGRK